MTWKDLLRLLAGIKPPSPKPPIPPAPSEATLAAITKDPQGRPLSDVLISLNDKPFGVTNADGYCARQITFGTYVMKAECAGWLTQSKNVIVNGNGDVNFLLQPAITIPSVLPWHREGLEIKNAAGNVQKVRGVTAFDAFRLFCNGEIPKLERYAAWTRSLGADTWRVFTMWSVTNHRSTPESRAQIEPFVNWCHDNGIRPWLVAFTDQIPGSSILLSTTEQDLHWDAIRRAGSDRTIIEVCNEAFKNGGNEFSARFDISTLPLALRSTPEDGQDPRAPGTLGALTNDHTPRDEEWHRKFKVLLETSRQGGPDFEPTNRPPIGGEPMRIEDAKSAADCADYFAGCELYGSGAIVHDGHALQYCELPPANELDKIAAIVASWNVIPPELFATGTYSRDDLNQVVSAPNALRNYALIAGDRAVAVCPSGNTDLATGTNGWRITDRKGFAGRILFLTR